MLGIKLLNGCLSHFLQIINLNHSSVKSSSRLTSRMSSGQVGGSIFWAAFHIELETAKSSLSGLKRAGGLRLCVNLCKFISNLEGLSSGRDGLIMISDWIGVSGF